MAPWIGPKNVQNGVPFHGHKPRIIISMQILYTIDRYSHMTDITDSVHLPFFSEHIRFLFFSFFPLIVCFTLSLESTSCFSLATLYQSPYLRFWSSFSWHFISFYKHTTLIIHNSLALSLWAQNLPFLQILYTIDRFSRMTDITDSVHLPFFSEHIQFLFFSFFPLIVCCFSHVW